MKTFVLEFKRFESDDKTTYSTFSLSSKAETTINDSDIDDTFESVYGVTSWVWLYQTYNNLFGRVRVVLLIQF